MAANWNRVVSVTVAAVAVVVLSAGVASASAPGNDPGMTHNKTEMTHN